MPDNVQNQQVPAQGEPPRDGSPAQPGTQQQAPQTWDAFVATLPAEAKVLYEGHITGLTNTVKATRAERDAFQERVKAITTALGQDPADVKRRLDELTAELERAERRGTFTEQAIQPEIGCRNPRVAYMVAEAQNLWTRRGDPDWAAIKQAAPELFGPAVARGHAGTGTNAPPATKTTMNDFIRRAAGRE
jgi:hypothetical protein